MRFSASFKIQDSHLWKKDSLSSVPPPVESLLATLNHQLESRQENLSSDMAKAQAAADQATKEWLGSAKVGIPRMVRDGDTGQIALSHADVSLSFLLLPSLLSIAGRQREEVREVPVSAVYGPQQECRGAHHAPLPLPQLWQGLQGTGEVLYCS